MPLSRERAVDLSHRISARLGRQAGVELGGTEEQVRNRILQLLLEWDRENERLQAEVKKKLLARPRHPPEGSREWDLLLGEEILRAYEGFLARGE